MLQLRATVSTAMVHIPQKAIRLEKMELCVLTKHCGGLVQTLGPLLSGIYEDGERDGVYVKKEDKTWHYELRGSFSTNMNGALPITRNEIIELLNLDTDHCDAQLDLLSKYNAHNCFCFYQ